MKEEKAAVAEEPHAPRSPRSPFALLRSYDHFAELEHNRGRFGARRTAITERLNKHSIINRLTPDLLNVHDAAMASPEFFEQVYFGSRTAMAIAKRAHSSEADLAAMNRERSRA